MMSVDHLRPPTRVLWLTKGLGRGGAENLLVELARCLRHTSFDLEVAYVLPRKDALVPDLETIGVRTHCLATLRPGGWVGSLWRLLRSGRYDVVHTHAPLVASAARVLAPRTLPFAHTEHNTWDRYRRPTRWANAITFRRNAVVWPVSRGVLESISRPGRIALTPRMEVMLHGIAPGRIQRGARARAAARSKLGLLPEQAAVVCVGNLTPKKDHPTLLAAMDLLRAHHPTVLHIIGTGPRERHLRTLVDQRGLRSRVSFLGSRDDVGDILPAYDAFALSSLHEGLPIAVLEAMAAGVPVVATRVGGVPEVVTDEIHGLVVPPRDPHALARALERLLTDSDLGNRLRTDGFRRTDEFGIENAARRLATAYDDLGAASRGVAAA